MRRVSLMARGLEDVVGEVVEVLEAGGVVAIPTDTCYGLAADATRPECVSRVFELKRRSLSKPISIFVDSVEFVLEEFEVDEIAERFLRLLPARLTLVLLAKKPGKYPAGIVGRSGGVGVRLSPHPLPTKLVERLGRPITATSANISGRAPLYDPRDVERELPGVDLVVDGGLLERVPTSTVVDLTVRPPAVLRAGAVPVEYLERKTGVKLVVAGRGGD